MALLRSLLKTRTPRHGDRPMGYLDKIGWSPTIGDPTFLGWFTVFAYTLVAIQSFIVCSHSRQLFTVDRVKLRYFWYCVGLVFCLLAINKQLDLQSFFTRAMKYMARDQGWYGYRRELQKIFIVAIAVSSVAIILVLLATFRQHWRTHFLAFFGIIFIVGFVLIRAASFHHIDILLGMGGKYLNVNHIVELTGITMVAANGRQLLNSLRAPIKRAAK